LYPSFCLFVESQWVELDALPIQAHAQVVLQQFRVGCGFLCGDHSVVVTVRQGQDLSGHGDAGREMNVQPDAAGLDGHEPSERAGLESAKSGQLLRTRKRAAAEVGNNRTKFVFSVRNGCHAVAERNGARSS
jgi:hypothetical protein